MKREEDSCFSWRWLAGANKAGAEKLGSWRLAAAWRI